MTHEYMIYFTGDRMPERIYSRDFIEFLKQIEEITFRKGKPFEWLIRI